MPISYLNKIIPSGTPRWLMGQTLHTPGREKFAGYKDKGLAWGFIGQEQLDAIEMLELWPDDQTTTQIPPVVARLPNLKALIIPSWFVATLRSTDLPDSLEVLQVGVSTEKKPKVSWNKDLTLPQIRSLDLGRVASDFYAGCFPGLRNTLTITAGNKRLLLTEICRCAQLKHLFLYKAGSVADLNMAGAPGLEFAAWMEARNADFDGLTGYHHLKEAEIKWNKSLISLRGLEQLTQLEQLEVSGCPKLEDLGTVAAMSRLKWLRVIDCGAAWAANETELKKRFTRAGFEKVRFESYGKHRLLEAWREL
ncbi:hypothetical protein LL912_01510 [Niabella sp. CC-SYL272]|uniref:hypothetical protein n=1 Tax=Niabella agricola TaxID=2891571 RepID=UPI001F18055A|nr:hypothetical protein [Niabella agricola]MCF3107446.1 hypothetical protein [Niabella agricola]